MDWLAFLLRLRETGMPIQGMQAFAGLRSQGDASVSERREMLEQHLAEVQARVQALQQSMQALSLKIEHYRAIEKRPSLTPTKALPRKERRAMTNSTQASQNNSSNDGNLRYARGLAKLQEIDGEGGVKVVESLADIAPDFARLLIEFPFGDVYSRPGLDLRAREIAVVAALTAMGNAAPQLKVHIQGALNVGVTRTEVVEIIMQMAVYAGFPAALNGLTAAREVFAAADKKSAQPLAEPRALAETA
jgi:4-carboxymuconolactone decarboxylase